MIGNGNRRWGNRWGIETGNALKERNKTCEICGKTLKNYKVLQRHMNSVHEGIKNHMCQICGRKFAQSGALKTHMYGYHKQAKKELTCQFCTSRYFEHVSNLKKHILSDHPEHVDEEAGCSKKQSDDGKNLLLCEYCSNEFKDATTLKKHILSDHSDQVLI